MAKTLKNPVAKKSPDKPAPWLTPHPKLFRAICVLFALWMVALLILYFWTVYPLRHR